MGHPTAHQLGPSRHLARALAAREQCSFLSQSAAVSHAWLARHVGKHRSVLARDFADHLAQWIDRLATRPKPREISRQQCFGLWLSRLRADARLGIAAHALDHRRSSGPDPLWRPDAALSQMEHYRILARPCLRLHRGHDRRQLAASTAKLSGWLETTLTSASCEANRSCPSRKWSRASPSCPCHAPRPGW